MVERPRLKSCSVFKLQDFLNRTKLGSQLGPPLAFLLDDAKESETCPWDGFALERKSCVPDAHGSSWSSTSLYLDASSAKTVTTTPSSKDSATRRAPARLAAEDGLRSRPSSLAARSALAWTPRGPSIFRHQATLRLQLWRPGAPSDWN